MQQNNYRAAQQKEKRSTRLSDNKSDSCELRLASIPGPSASVSKLLALLLALELWNNVSF